MMFQQKYKQILLFFIAIVLASASLSAISEEHPCLIVNKEELVEMQLAMEIYPDWKHSVEVFLTDVEDLLSKGIDVPLPKDPAGGYTHSQHKMNGKALKQAGMAYLISADEKYACYARDMFLEYVKLYPSLGEHPIKKSYAPGKLFWQQLNEAVWLTDAIQAYDAIYNFLSRKDRKKIEEYLLFPYADFLSIENKEVFNRIHNHGVWAVAAVGMTGIVTGREELTQRALYGIDAVNKPFRTVLGSDNLGELEAGFLVQTLSLFSPDGYYTEGPYYQRYAMTPFLLLAQSLANNVPELNMMEFGGGIYVKAVQTLVDLTDAKGRYIAINDNLKGMSIYSPESIAALCFLYEQTEEVEILDLLDEVQISTINSAGLKVVKDLSTLRQKLANGEVESDAVSLKRGSKLISDGSDGEQGGLGIIRDVDDEFTAVLKYASHGLSHGHFDRLNLYYYQNDNEILSNYGSVRYVNIQAKEGGRYLPENNSYAKQTVAHNSLVVNEESHFGGVYKTAQACHSNLVYAALDNKAEQFVCATEANAYEGVTLTRIAGLIEDEAFIHPLLLDVVCVYAEAEQASYDLPYHFDGEVLDLNFDYHPSVDKMEALGDDHGYQHLWKTASGITTGEYMSLSWLDAHTIHTLYSATSEHSEMILARTGANDPDFNLRSEPVLLIREKNKKDHAFATVLEVHGNQNESTEMVSNQDPSIKGISVLYFDEEKVAVEFKTAGKAFVFLSLLTEGDETENELVIGDKSYKWSGNYKLIKQ